MAIHSNIVLAPNPGQKDLPYHHHISSSCVPASEESDELLRPAHYHHIIITSSSCNDHVIIMLSYHHIIIWGVWFSEVIDQPLIMITSSSNHHNIIISSYHRHHIFIWGSARRWGLMKFSDCFSPPSTSLLAFNEKTTTNWTEYFCIFVFLFFHIFLFLQISVFAFLYFLLLAFLFPSTIDVQWENYNKQQNFWEIFLHILHIQIVFPFHRLPRQICCKIQLAAILSFAPNLKLVYNVYQPQMGTMRGKLTIKSDLTRPKYFFKLVYNVHRQTQMGKMKGRQDLHWANLTMAHLPRSPVQI